MNRLAKNLLMTLLLWAVGTSLVHAHGLKPLLLSLEQTDSTHWQINLKKSVDNLQPVQLNLPSSCTTLESAEERIEGDSSWTEWRGSCPQGLLHIGLEGLGDYQAVVSVNSLAGGRSSGLLSAQSPRFDLSQPDSKWTVFSTAALSGMGHLLIGLDHLLFVIGLTLFLGKTRGLLIAVTGFTVGHSITLILTSLGPLSIPGALAELGIAASLLVLALQLVEDPQQKPGWSWVLLMPLAFGLVHGLGFAGALLEDGLSSEGMVWIVLGFNLGIEIAQLGCVAAVLMVLAWKPRRFSLIKTASVYGIGSMAVFWMLERLPALTVI